MSSSFRPSWAERIDGQGDAAPSGPRLLVALLLGFGLFAAFLGGGISSAANDARLHTTVLGGALWSAPYFLSALFCWYGGDRFWYALAKALGIWGALIGGGGLLACPQMGDLAGGPRTPMGPLEWLILVGLLIGHVAIFFAARAEAAARGVVDHNDRLLYGVYTFLPVWYLLTLVVA